MKIWKTRIYTALALLFIMSFWAAAQQGGGITTSTARHIRWGTSTPATCSVGSGDVFFKTSATVALYICSAPNTWTALGTGGGTGTVTSAVIAGTANQITASGTCTITTTGTCTLSLVAAMILGVDNTTTGSIQVANGSANAHTIWGSGATTSNTINGFATVPTTGHVIDCTVTSTTCLLHDSGVVTANVVNASSPGAGIARFAGSTQTATSSELSGDCTTSGSNVANCNGPSVSAYNHATQSISGTTDTILLFDSELWDTGNMHSISSNTGRLVAPTTGYYIASCGVTVSSAASISLSIRVNNAVPNSYANSETTLTASQNASAAVTQIVHLTATDYVICDIFSLTGVTTTADFTFGQLTRLSTSF